MKLIDQIKSVQRLIKKATEATSIVSSIRFESTDSMIKIIEAKAMLQNAYSKLEQIVDEERFINQHKN